MKLRTANIWTASGLPANSIAKSFKLSFTDILQLNAIGTSCAGSIEIDRNAVTPPEAEPSLAGQGSLLQPPSAELWG